MWLLKKALSLIMILYIKLKAEFLNHITGRVLEYGIKTNLGY